MKKKHESIKELIESASEIVGSVSGTFIGAALLGPTGLLISGVSGAIIKRLFVKAGKEIGKRYLGDRETARIGYTYALAFQKIKLRLENGESLRDDDFFENGGSNRSAADEILEGVMRSAQIEHQENKLPYLSNLLANIAFDSSIDKNKANFLLKITQNLSYQQLCILQFFSTHEPGKGYNLSWSYKFNAMDILQNDNTLEPSVEELIRYKLLSVMRNGEAIQTVGIRKLGLQLGSLMELNEIDKEVIDSLETKFVEIKRLIDIENAHILEQSRNESRIKNK